jgi:hypothetical protein
MPNVREGHVRRIVEDVVVGPRTGSGHRIERIWIAVSVLEDTDEAVPIVVGPQGQEALLMASDEIRLEWVIRHARDWAKMTGKPVRLLKFEPREHVETFHPDGRRERTA